MLSPPQLSYISMYGSTFIFVHKLLVIKLHTLSDLILMTRFKSYQFCCAWLYLSGCARGFIANSFSSFWLGFAYQEPPRPIFSPISREYSGNIVFHIYRATFLVAKKTMTASILQLENFLLSQFFIRIE